MYEIMALSGQEYVDVYASRAKDDAKRVVAERKRLDKAA
jgi:1-acyl-sn-glycerol-3-phosphate acyltransferase